MNRLGMNDVALYRKMVSDAAQCGMSVEDYFSPVYGENQPPAAPVQLKECAVCFEELPETFQTRCHAHICRPCLKTYCDSMVQEEGINYNDKDNSFAVNCPACRNASCSYLLNKDEAKEYLGIKVYNNLKERASRNIEGMKACPHPGCTSSYFEDDARDALRDGHKFISCTNLGGCYKNICATCGGMYENPHRCDAQKILKMDFNDRIKPCPNPGCHCVIERNEGCLTMVCGGNPDNPAQGIIQGHCGATFCWQCGVWIEHKPRQRQSLFNPETPKYLPKTKTPCQHTGQNAFNCSAPSTAWWKKE